MADNINSDHDQQSFGFFKQIHRRLNTNPTEINYKVNYIDIFHSILSIFFRLVGITINCYVAYVYFHNGHQNHFIYTVYCITVPMIIVMCIQVAM